MAKWLSYLNGGCAEHLAKSGTLTLPKRKLTPLLRLRCPSRRVVSVTFKRRQAKQKSMDIISRLSGERCSTWSPLSVLRCRRKELGTRRFWRRIVCYTMKALISWGGTVDPAPRWRVLSSSYEPTITRAGCRGTGTLDKETISDCVPSRRKYTPS